ncbi:MAG: glycosyltransferase [Egibacteraceae bacterium]
MTASSPWPTCWRSSWAVTDFTARRWRSSATATPSPLEAALARACVRERVTFTGWIASAAVPDHVRRADICLDPALGSQLNHHSTMIKIAEYMAACKPVVARDLVETRRTLGEAGVLVSSSPGAEGLAAACAALAADPARRAELGRRALERVHGMTWEHSERRLLAAYRDLEGPAGTRA